MENMAEALKMAFAVLLFIMALTLSMSSFSNATTAVKNIISIRDRETEYTYVTPTSNFSRTVGIETVVSSIYRSLIENIEIHFLESDEVTPIALYYDTDIYHEGYLKKDGAGMYKEIYSIDLQNENLTSEIKNMHLDIILGGTSVIDDAVEKALTSKTNEEQEKYKDMYNKKIRNHYPQGLFEAFKNKTFTEYFGQYTQGDGASEITKRVITYVVQ